MAAMARKRKPEVALGEPIKRLRLERVPETQGAYSPWAEDDDVEGEDYKLDNDRSSGEEEAADSPITPFSPIRKKFPSEMKTIKCTYDGCPKTFNRPARLTAHLRTHTNERPYICSYDGCAKSYFEDKHLQQHVKGSHTHERTFHCDWQECGKSFLTSTRLKRHKDTHVGHERFRCSGYSPCNQTFRKHNTLQRHIRSEHMNLAPYPCKFVDPITGEDCDAGFDGATGLRQHTDRVHVTAPAKFFCIQCAAPGFNTDRSLQAHIKKEHANCIFCELECSSNSELMRHIEIQHTGLTLEERKRVACTYPGCDKKFTKKNNLKTHIRTAHEGERYICGTFDLDDHPDIPDFESCGDDFVSKASLIDHIRTAHLGLPSVVNANRKRTTRHDANLVEGHDSENIGPRTRARKPRSSAIDDLTGQSYSMDPRRSITCTVSGCPYKFMREYDLHVHMNSAHPVPAPTFEGAHFPPPASPPYMFQGPSQASMFQTSFHGFDAPANVEMGTFNSPNGYMEPSMYNNTPKMMDREPELQCTGLAEVADIDWELQRKDLEEGPFWMGTDNGLSGLVEGQDAWMQDHEEMSRSAVEGN